MLEADATDAGPKMVPDVLGVAGMSSGCPRGFHRLKPVIEQLRDSHHPGFRNPTRRGLILKFADLFLDLFLCRAVDGLPLPLSICVEAERQRPGPAAIFGALVDAGFAPTAASSFGFSRHDHFS